MKAPLLTDKFVHARPHLHSRFRRLVREVQCAPKNDRETPALDSAAFEVFLALGLRDGFN